MTRKPKSWAALVRAVIYADLSMMPSQKTSAKRADKNILICIANNGSDTGAGARPGNENLKGAANLGWSQLHEHLRLLEKAGMIERTGKGGRGLASSYRILWNHPAFPDCAPNMREWFCIGEEVSPEKPSGFDSENCPVSEETVRLQRENHPVSDAKPSGLEAKKGQNHSVSIAGAQPTLPTQNQPTSLPADWLAGFLKLCGPQMEKWPRTKTDEAWLEQVVARHGIELSADAARRWLSAGREFDKLRETHWATWKRDGIEPWIRDAIYHSPEAEKAREDAAIELARINHPAAYVDGYVPESAEPSLEETERMLKELAK